MSSDYNVCVPLNILQSPSLVVNSKRGDHPWPPFFHPFNATASARNSNNNARWRQTNLILSARYQINAFVYEPLGISFCPNRGVLNTHSSDVKPDLCLRIRFRARQKAMLAVHKAKSSVAGRKEGSWWLLMLLSTSRTQWYGCRDHTAY